MHRRNPEIVWFLETKGQFFEIILEAFGRLNQHPSLRLEEKDLLIYG